MSAVRASIARGRAAPPLTPSRLPPYVLALDTSAVLRLILGVPAAQAEVARRALLDAQRLGDTVVITDTVVGEHASRPSIITGCPNSRGHDAQVRQEDGPPQRRQASIGVTGPRCQAASRDPGRHWSDGMHAGGAGATSPSLCLIHAPPRLHGYDRLRGTRSGMVSGCNPSEGFGASGSDGLVWLGGIAGCDSAPPQTWKFSRTWPWRSMS